MKPLICGVVASLVTGCSTLVPTVDQVPDDSGYGSVIESEYARVSIVYAGKKHSRPVFLVTVTNYSDDTLLLEPQIIRYFASASPFVSVQDAPDDWMALSAQNSKLPMTMHFAVDPRSIAADSPQDVRPTSTWKTVLPHTTMKAKVFLHPEALYKYYRLVMPMSGDYYVFDFVRDAKEGIMGGLALGILETSLLLMDN
jgi:hypothetical protein